MFRIGFFVMVDLSLVIHIYLGFIEIALHKKKKYGLHTLRKTNSQVCPKNGCLKHKSCPFSKLAKIFQSSFKTQLIH